MKLLLILSALASISAVQVPGIWPNGNPNLSNTNRDVRPIREDATLPQQKPNYNNVNTFTNNVPNSAPNSLVANGNIFPNIPLEYNWFTAPNADFNFITPSNQINSGNLLSSNLNSLINSHRNQIGRNSYVPQRQVPPRLVQTPTSFKKPPLVSNNPVAASFKEVPGQVPYITFTTRQPTLQNQATAFSTLQPIQNSRQVNIKQAYPQVTSPKTTVPLKELDFSPRNPFPQPGSQANVQINKQNGPYSTAQPISNLDFSLDNPFSRNPPFNNIRTQTSRIPLNKPLFTAADTRKPKYNPSTVVRNLEFNPFLINYRDHRTHEPTQFEPNYDTEPIPKVERLQSEIAPVVKNHEYPPEVPTKPIYPGEGRWAKPGVKHRPFVSKQQYGNLEEGSNEKPDGYDTFLEGQQLFENQKAQFGQKLQPTHQPTEENNKETETFVPTRLYAQVRHSEDEKHLPPESDENGRLKELVKDTKIQTIYSEEGYEDSAYDHAGHEKNAESSEGFESDEKNEEDKKTKKIPLKKIDRQSESYSIGDKNLKEADLETLKNEDLNIDNENEEKSDSESAGTHYEEPSYINKIKPTKTKELNKKAHSLLKPKEVKTVTATDRKRGNIEMEISSEVKAILQPNNATKFHKYVKIYPKMYKSTTSKINPKENINTTPFPQIYPVSAERRSLEVRPDDISIEEVTTRVDSSDSLRYISTTPSPSEYGEIVTMEIPTTTLATTAIPKLKTNTNDTAQKNTKRPVYTLKLRKRRKRFAVGIPTIEVDTDFIDEINHDLGKATEKPKTSNENKYPYYRSYQQKGLHEGSPLRYSEDLKNVPIKTEGKLAFYDQADKKMICSDVNPEVDPVPDRIKNADEGVEEEEEDEEGNDPATKKPRLGQLGDKIDCFKVKYFGENPFDNPIFQEQSVGTIKPIFSEIEKISTNKIGKNSDDTEGRATQVQKGKENLKVSASNIAENEIDDTAPYKQKLSWFPGKHFGMGENTERESKFLNHFVDKNPNPKINVEPQVNSDSKAHNLKDSAKEVQTLPPATLITTPKYTIDLKPKHIYDQIQLLEYLPEEELDEFRKEINADILKINKPEMTTPLPNTNKTETVLNPPIIKKKKENKKGSARKGKMLKNSEENMRMETSDEIKPQSLPDVEALQLRRPKPKKPLYEIFDVNKFLPKVPKIPFPARISPTSNKYLAPVSIVNPTYEIFDVNKYLPTTPFPLFKDFISRSTVLPKYKVLSEVFYKEDIKPNEQLNVFRDVLNNIKNFPNFKHNFPESSQPLSIKIDPEKILEKYPQNFFQDKDEDKNDYFSSTITTIMTTFDPKMYASNHKYVQAESPTTAEKELEDLMNDRQTTSKRKRRRRIKTTTQHTPVVIEQSTSTLRYIGDATEVMGLMPPATQGYKTIYHPKRDNNQHISGPTVRIEERKINKYFVRGMRPPPKQKIYLYSDFLTDNHIAQTTNKPKRTKRNAQRPAYAQVSRNRNKQTTPEAEPKKEEGEDDYIPQRTRNYHYDEKTGKIVYDKKPQESTEDEEEVEYIEVVEETPKTTEKPKQNPIFATVTPPPEGQSYTDFVKLLKSASNYHEIPDPTTTEKGPEEVTQELAASTLQSVSTSPPEFLSILAKVRNDTTYKLIEDKKDNKKATTTSSPAEEEEVVDDESQAEDVKNSPGGQGYENGANLEIFDISDFLPNIKSYLPKTSVDTSKYKTIERPNVRHSLSSRYNSEEEKNLQNVDTNKQPLLQSEKVLTRGAVPDEIKTKERIRNTDNPSTTSKPEEASQKPVRILRRRTTTPRSVQENNESSSQASLTPAATANESNATESKTDQVQPNKERRRRRRPKRLRVKPTTESALEANQDDTTKILHRRSERDSHLRAEGNEQYEQIIENYDTPKVPARPEDYVDFEDIPDVSTETKEIHNISEVAKKVVDIFKNYDKDKKHGGNYKKEDEVIEQNLQKIPATPTTVVPQKVKETTNMSKVSDKIKKHSGNYKAEKEIKAKDKLRQIPVKPTETSQENVNENVEVFKDYDKTKKHGGNYKSVKDVLKTKNQLKSDVKNEERIPDDESKPVEQEDTSLIENESIQVKNVNVFQDIDQTKKHGGNYKSELETLSEQKDDINLERPALQENVEVFKDYDETKKHGGNYKPQPKSQEQQIEETQFKSQQNLLNNNTEKRSVEVFRDYDKLKKHGGNYISEEDKLKQLSLLGKNDDVEVFKNYNKAKKTGGNYRRQEESNEPSVDETHSTNSPQKKRYIKDRKDVQRLADVVVKPEAIYSDLTLPFDINALKIVKDLSAGEIEEIADSVETEIDDKQKDNVASIVIIGNKNKTPPVIDVPSTTTKKPLFIKDPSKRLYYYAPVR